MSLNFDWISVAQRSYIGKRTMNDTYIGMIYHLPMNDPISVGEYNSNGDNEYLLYVMHHCIKDDLVKKGKL